MGIIICDDDTCPAIKLYLKTCVSFLSEYSWLCDAYIIDFFTENHWQKLPVSWQSYFQDVNFSELSSWLRYGSGFRKVMPLSLLAFRRSTQLFGLERTSLQNAEFISSYIIDNVKSNNSNKKSNVKTSSNWPNVEEEFTSSGKQHKNLYHVFRRHVKPKKQHEISRLAEVITEASKHLKIYKLVDVGAGQGHLSRLLSFEYNYDVITMDAENFHTSHASKFDDQAVQFIKKKYQNENKEIKQPVHMTLTLTPHISTNIFTEMLSEEFRKNYAADQGNLSFTKNFGIIGLHTCGNLAPTIIRLFQESEDCSFLISLSCCYMKMFDHTKRCIGYPLSNLLSNLNHKLSYEAMEVACHAIEIYSEKLKNEYEKLKVHCYRATLEVFITRRFPHLKRLGLRSIKYTKDLSFKQYAVRALERMDFNNFPEVDMKSEDVEFYMTQWKKIIVFYSLRLSVAPVIESVVLLDRLIFLHEKGICGCLAPIFDPILSPRNIALIAIKSKKT